MHDLPLTEPVAVFTVVLLVLLAAPLIGRRGVPSAVVLLGAGIALGPHALGVLARDPTMVLLGTVGLLYIMFLAGLEIDLHEFERGRAQSLALGLATFVLPQLVGTLIGWAFLGMGWMAAILLGSVFASHTLLAYPAAARLGIQKERSVTAAVGATILTDTLALLVLAVIATAAREGGAVELAVFFRVAGSLLVVGGIVLWGLPRLGAWFFRTAASDATLEFVFVLAAVFVCALGVEELGVEPIIGAFLAGLGLNRLVPEGGPLMNRIGFIGNALFVPFFLLSTGMLVDLSAFAGGPESARAWTVALTMTGILLVTKGASAWMMRPAFGFTGDEVKLVFGLTVPQAAATLAAVLVGVEVGLFDAAVLNGTIAMVFVTCLIGPFVVERAGRRVAALAEVRSEKRDGRGGARQRLLVSLANPATVGPLVDFALLAREPGASEPLVAVTVVPSGPDQAEGVVRGERLLSAAVVHAAGAAVPVLPLVRVETNVARALARAAAETRATTVVTGWDGSAAAERVLFGSVPDRVLQETSAAVLVTRGVTSAATIGRLIVVVPPLAEMEPGFGAGARLLAGVASRAGARLVILTPDAHRDAVLAAFARAGRPPEAGSLASWSDLPTAVDAVLRPTDALALVSARQGAVAWQASLDRLPRVLARRHPDLPLLVLYPGQVPASTTLPAGLTHSERAFLDRLTPDRIRLGLRPGAPADLFRQTLGAVLAEPALSETAEALAAVPADARPEVRPGVVLSHVRTETATEPVLTIGVSRDGVDVPGASGPVHVVLLLVVPERVPSRRYLAWLALVARMVQADATVEAVRQAPTPEAARAALLAPLHTPEGEAAPVGDVAAGDRLRQRLRLYGFGFSRLLSGGRSSPLPRSRRCLSETTVMTMRTMAMMRTMKPKPIANDSGERGGRGPAGAIGADAGGA